MVHIAKWTLNKEEQGYWLVLIDTRNEVQLKTSNVQNAFKYELLDQDEEQPGAGEKNLSRLMMTVQVMTMIKWNKVCHL